MGDRVLAGYRAVIFPEEYDPPSGAKAEYDKGWELACFDLAAKRLADTGVFCRCNPGPLILGGSDYQEAEPFGVFTGTTFVMQIGRGGDRDGCVIASVSNIPGRDSRGRRRPDQEAMFGGGPEVLLAAIEEAVDFVIGVVPPCDGPPRQLLDPHRIRWAAVRYFPTSTPASSFGRSRANREYIWAVFHKGRA